MKKEKKSNASLTVWAQSDGKNRGRLVAKGGDKKAGIGCLKSYVAGFTVIIGGGYAGGANKDYIIGCVSKCASGTLHASRWYLSSQVNFDLAGWSSGIRE